MSERTAIRMARRSLAPEDQRQHRRRDAEFSELVEIDRFDGNAGAAHRRERGTITNVGEHVALVQNEDAGGLRLRRVRAGSCESPRRRRYRPCRCPTRSCRVRWRRRRRAAQARRRRASLRRRESRENAAMPAKPRRPSSFPREPTPTKAVLPASITSLPSSNPGAAI